MKRISDKKLLECLAFLAELEGRNNILNPRKFIVPKEDDKILLVGVEHNEITRGGKGSQIYSSFEEVKLYFPDIDPLNATDRFTWSLGYQDIDGERMVRFETAQARNLY